MKNYYYNENKIKLIIKRYDYDTDPPDNIIVGFQIINTENNLKKYIESLIKYNSSYSQQQAVQLAYINIKNEIDVIKQELEKDSIIGTEFIPL